MTDPTKKDDSEKAKAVKDAMTRTSDSDAKSPPATPPVAPPKEPSKMDVPTSTAAKTTPGGAATPPEGAPPEGAKEPPKPAAPSPTAASPSTASSAAASPTTQTLVT